MSNDHNVYVLGAGFSVEAGIPPVHPFLYRMQEAQAALRATGRIAEADAIKKVLKFRLGASSAAYRVNVDLDNIEDLFSLASADPASKLDDELPLAIAGTIDHFQSPPTRNVVVDGSFTVPTAWSPEGNPNKYVVPLYDIYVGAMLGSFGLSGVKNTIITFNYDTVVEDALGRLGISYTYGLKGNELGKATPLPAGCVHPYKPTSNDLRVLKLQGSMNWAAGGGAAGAAGRAKLHKDYAAVVATGKPPVLVPPTWKKTFGAQLDRVWNRAVEALATATRVIIIGFSAPATDVHFRYLLAAGLKSNIALGKVVVVNPDRDGMVEDRMRALFSSRVTTRGEIETVNGDRGYTSKFFFDAQSLGKIGRWDDGLKVQWI